MFSRLKLYIAQHRTWIVILFLLATSLSLRLINLEGRWFWYGDTGRDAMVARHMAVWHEVPVVGHASAWLPGSYHYPTFYYFLIAAVSYINSDALFIEIFFVVLTSLVPILIFGIGKNMFSFSTGLYSGFLVAASTAMVYKANAWGAFIVLPFFYGGMYALTSPKKENWVYVIGVIVLFFSTTIHLSAVVPAIIIAGIYVYENPKKLQNILIIFSVLCALYMQNFLQAGSDQIIKIFTFKDNYILDQSILAHMWTHVNRIWVGLVDGNDTFVYITVLCLIISSALGLYLSNKSFRRRILYICLPVIMTIVAASVFKNPPDVYVFSVITPLILLFVGVLTIQLIQTRPLLIKIVGVLSLFVYPWCFINGFPQMKNHMFLFEESKTLVGTVMTYANNNTMKPVVDFMVFGSNGKGDYLWESPKYWYFIEQEYKQKITTVVNEGKNLAPIGRGWKTILLICGPIDSDAENHCVQDLLDNFPNYRQSAEIWSPVDKHIIYVFTLPVLNKK